MGGSGLGFAFCDLEGSDIFGFWVVCCFSVFGFFCGGVGLELCFLRFGRLLHFVLLFVVFLFFGAGPPPHCRKQSASPN